MEQDATFGTDGARDKDGIAFEAESERQAAQDAAQRHAVRPLVAGVDVLIAAGVVELVLGGVDDGIVGGHLAKVDLRPGDSQRRIDALRWDIAHQQVWQPLLADLGDGAQAQPIAVRVDEVLVDPRSRVLAQLLDVQFSHRQRDLAQATVERVAVHVHVRKGVVGADLLELLVGSAQRLPVPQPHVVENVGISLQLLGGQVACDPVVGLLDVLQAVGVAGKADVMLDVRPLQRQFIGLHGEALHE